MNVAQRISATGEVLEEVPIKADRTFERPLTARKGETIRLQIDDQISMMFYTPTGSAYTTEYARFKPLKRKNDMAKPESPPGQDKLHTIQRTNPDTGEIETQQVTQEGWRTGPYKDEGWVRVDDDEAA